MGEAAGVGVGRGVAVGCGVSVGGGVRVGLGVSVGFGAIRVASKEAVIGLRIGVGADRESRSDMA